VLHIKIRGDWSFVSKGLSPPMIPRAYATVWQNFSLLCNASDLQKYFSYAICQTFCLWAWRGPKWHNAFR